MARDKDLGLPRIPGNAADPARVIGKTGGKVSGWDYCVEPDQTEDCDDDMPGGLIIENAKGGPYGSGA